MTLQNRVDPFGRVVATSARGTLMGNRGTLHDAGQRIVRQWQRKAWIICRLQWKGRHRQVMAPGSYTELFFLDEATALAAGHRPCSTCRRDRLQAFVAAWCAGNGAGRVRTAEIDARLHGERFASAGEAVLQEQALSALPDGVMVLMDGAPEQPLLWWRGRLHSWSFAGYGAGRRPPRGTRVRLLTPASTAAALAAGYVPEVHASVTRPVTAAEAVAARAEAPQPAAGAPPASRRSGKPAPAGATGTAPRRPASAPHHAAPRRRGGAERSAAGGARRTASLYRLEPTPRGRELWAYFAAVLRETGMERGAVYPLERFLSNFSGHVRAGRIERAPGGWRLTAAGRRYFADRLEPGNPQHVAEADVRRYQRLIRKGGPGWVAVE